MSDDAVRPLRIAIADDHPIFRHGLRKLLEVEPGFVVVGEARSGDEAVALVRSSTPDVLLLDLAMPRATGLDVLRELSGAADTVKIVLLTAAITKAEINAALQLGAAGVLLKDSASEMLYKCIRSVAAGQHWIPRDSVTDLVEVLRQTRRGAVEPPSPRGRVTARELEVIRAVVAGATNKEIAAQFGLSEQTVKNHLSSVFDKLGVSTRLELALYAVNHKLLEE